MISYSSGSPWGVIFFWHFGCCRWGRGATGILWDDAERPTKQRSPSPQERILWSKMSIVQRVTNCLNSADKEETHLSSVCEMHNNDSSVVVSLPTSIPRRTHSTLSAISPDGHSFAALWAGFNVVSFHGWRSAQPLLHQPPWSLIGSVGICSGDSQLEFLRKYFCITWFSVFLYQSMCHVRVYSSPKGRLARSLWFNLPWSRAKAEGGSKSSLDYFTKAADPHPVPWNHQS